jgi:hypothetical protein
MAYFKVLSPGGTDKSCETAGHHSRTHLSDLQMGSSSMQHVCRSHSVLKDVIHVPTCGYKPFLLQNIIFSFHVQYLTTFILNTTPLYSDKGLRYLSQYCNRLQARRPGLDCSILLFSTEFRPAKGLQSLLTNGYQWYSGQGTKLTTHLHLVLRRMVELYLYSSICPHGTILN